MTSRDRDGWTLLLLRRGGTESRRLELGGPWPWVLGGVAVLAVLLVGALAGGLWSDARSSARIAALEEELSQVRGEQARVAELARRLEEMREDYARIRRALGADGAGNAGDVRLPDLPEGVAPAAAEAPADPSLPSAWPLAAPGFVTRSFGTHLERGAAGHPGLDIAVPVGSYVRAAGGGRVVAAGPDSVYGYHVRIAHRDGLSSLYAHNSWLFVAAGDSVERLQVIALSGSTGQSTAPHLHFEVRRGGEVVDPLEYVPLAGR